MVSLRRPAFVLEADLTSAPVEVEPDDLVGKFRTRHRPRLRALLKALHEAGSDQRVRGLVVKVGGGLPWALAQEIRAGLAAFAASGKPCVAWAESLGEGGNGSADYLLASGAGEVWLQPSGEVALLGVAAETTFLRGALDKLGVQPQLEQRYEYKNAADVVMRTEYSDAHREAVDALTGSVWEAALLTIAAARKLEPEAVRALADRGPLAADEALDAGLVDKLGYRDEVYAELKRRTDGAGLLFADQWRPRRRAATLVRPQKDYVALVDGHGEIGAGRSRPRRMGSDSIGAAFRAVRDDEHARAVLFRVDSPGGSAVASDTIWRDVALTREAGKPVIVSMGAVAGSGGYYVACGADAILAQPATITGSIGVLGGKLVIGETLERIGLTTGAVAHGDKARMYSPRRSFSDEEFERLNSMLDRIYRDFVQKVADGRGLSWDETHERARGRIWSGTDALANGLVDRLGGLRDAADLARERAGLRADAPVRPAVHIPPLARLGRAKSSADPRAALTSGWGDLAALAAAMRLPAGGPLRMSAIRLR